MLSTAIYSTAAYLAYQWYNQKEKRLRIVLKPESGIDVHDHIEKVNSLFSGTNLAKSIGLSGYASLTSHIENMPERIVITIDIKYHWRCTWDIGNLWIPGFEVSLSEIYDR